MILVTHLCVPEGEPMRAAFAEEMARVRADNIWVIDAMIAEGRPVADTVAGLKIPYVEESFVIDPELALRLTGVASSEPIFQTFGLRAMIQRGRFSCADAAAYEAAVATRKYNVPTECVSVPLTDATGQIKNQYHAVYVTPEEVIDPVARFQKRLPAIRKNPGVGRSLGCRIEDGRVRCNVPGASACVDPKNGVWRGGPRSGRKEQLAEVNVAQGWARTRGGTIVPLCPPAGGRR